MATADDKTACRESMKAFVEKAKGKPMEGKEREKLRYMDNKACSKMMKDCFPKVNLINDSDLAHAKAKTKGQNAVDLDNDSEMNKLIDELALVLKKNKISTDEAKCKEILVEKIKVTKPNIKAVKISKTGNVDGMTDTSKYTGAHKERFDDSGKGKGASGRTDKADNTGYVGQYKGAGTYDKK